MGKRVKSIFKKGKEINGMRKIFFHKPITKFVMLILLYILLSNILRYFPKRYGVRIPIVFVEIFIAGYFIVIMVYMIRGFVNQLLKPKNLFFLIGAYALFLFGIIIIFSTVFNIAELGKFGYMRYGDCTSNFKPEMIAEDSAISRDYFYFSAITFFTVGYGDICPMGAARQIAVVAAFTGHVVSVLVVALIINNYLYLRRKND